MAGKDYDMKTRISMMGDKEYKQAVTDINRELTVLKSELTASQSAFKGQEGSMDALRDKHSKLSAIYDAQAKKVEMMSAKLEAAKESGNASSKELDNMTIALNKAKAAMNTTAAEIGKTEKEMKDLEEASEGAGDASEDAAKGMNEAADAAGNEADQADDAEKSNSKLGSALKTVGSVAAGALVVGLKAAAASMAALAAGTVATTKAAFDMATGAGTYADDLLTLSVQTGLATDRLQGMSYAARFIDTDTETITKSMARMTKTMGDAAGGSSSAAEKFSALGVSITDANGSMRSSEEVFADCIDALGGIENEAQRDALAMDLFGKSAQELNPLIEAGGDALNAMCAEAEEMGTVFSSDALAAMGSFDDSMQRVQATGDALKNAIGLTVIPAFQPLVDTASSAMASVSKALQDGLQPGELEAITQSVLTSAQDAVNQISGLIAAAAPIAQEALSGVVGMLVEMLPGLVDTLLPAAMGLLQSMVDAIAANVAPLASLATNVLTSIAGFLIENASMLLDAAVSIVLGLVDGLTESLPQLLPVAMQMMVQLAVGLITAIPELIARLPEIVAAIWEGLGNVDWAGLGLQILEAIMSTLGTVDTLLGGAFAKGLEVIMNIDWSGIGKAIWNGITSVIDAVGNWIRNLFGAGKSAAEGIDWSGIGSAILGGITSVIDGVGSWFKNLFSAGKSAAEALDWGGVGSAIAGGVGSVVDGAGSWLAGSFESAKNAILGIDWGGLGSSISSGLSGALDTLGQIGGNLWDMVSGWFGWGEDEAVEASEAQAAGAAITENIGAGIAGGTTDLATAANNAATACVSAFKASFGMSEGGEGGLGSEWMSGIVSGITGQQEALASAATAAGEGAETALGEIVGEDNGKIIGGDFVQGISTGMSGKIASLRTTAASLATAARSALSTAVGLGGSSFRGIGTAIAQGVATGISNSSGLIANAARRAARSAYATAKDELGIASPSKKMAEIGQWFDQGFALGIERNMDQVLESAERLSNMAAASTAQSKSAFESNFELDYERLGDAVARANRDAGIGTAVIDVNGREFGSELEPYTSRAARERTGRSVKGRTGRMVLV